MPIAACTCLNCLFVGLTFVGDVLLRFLLDGWFSGWLVIDVSVVFLFGLATLDIVHCVSFHV